MTKKTITIRKIETLQMTGVIRMLGVRNDTTSQL